MAYCRFCIKNNVATVVHSCPKEGRDAVECYRHGAMSRSLAYSKNKIIELLKREVKRINEIIEELEN